MLNIVILSGFFDKNLLVIHALDIGNNEPLPAITTLVFQPLLAFPEIALDPKNKHHKKYSNEHLTPLEFENVLGVLHNLGYCLISLNSNWNHSNSENVFHSQNFPKNKKPLIIVFENLNYDSSNNSGLINKIILDRYNKLASYNTKKSIKDKVSHNNECLLVLNNFIETHPDFSHNNARGIIALNGFDGILGYNTQHKNANSRREVKRAMEIVLYLKKTGWSFCYNGYNNTSLTELSDMEFAKDLSFWNSEIKSIIDITPIMLLDKKDSTLLSCFDKLVYKQKLLLSNNFNIFLSKSDDFVVKKVDIQNDTALHLSCLDVNLNTIKNTPSLKKIFRSTIHEDELRHTISNQ